MNEIDKIILKDPVLKELYQNIPVFQTAITVGIAAGMETKDILIFALKAGYKAWANTQEEYERHLQRCTCQIIMPDER